ncbi:hypothetical protein MRX96_016696 [Rhipicephalus microplus]
MFSAEAIKEEIVQTTEAPEMAVAAEIEPRKLKAIVAVLSIMVNDYVSKLSTLLQLVHRQRKLLHALAAIRQKKREKPRSLPRVPVNCCPGRAQPPAGLPAQRDAGLRAPLSCSSSFHWLAMGTSYRAIVNTFGIPRSTIHGVVFRYVNNFANQLSMLIQPPQTEAKLRVVTEGFSALCSSESFGAAAGVIDTCRITTALGDTSVLVQALCDSHGHFLDFSVGYPATMDPADVFQASPLYEKPSYPPQGYFLIAGEGYPCLTEPLTVMPPFRKPLQNEAEASFNAICNRGLAVLHDALTQLTGRWRLVFERRLSTVVAICAMIHNLCVDEGDVWYDVSDEPSLSMEPAGDFSWCVPGDEELDDEAGLIARSNLGTGAYR